MMHCQPWTQNTHENISRNSGCEAEINLIYTYDINYETNVPEDINDNSQEEYILPTSNSGYLTEKDLEGLGKEELRLARNEIYARYGRKFDDGQLQAYFDSCSWYYGSIQPDSFKESMLSDYEIYNRNLIVAYEKKIGY